jgi:hypothetical protein
MTRKLAPRLAAPRARIGAYAGLVVSLAGCPNPNLYTTPRTLARGQFQAQVALETMGARYTSYSPQYANGAQLLGQPLLAFHNEAAAPVLPSVGIRFGVEDGLEMGFRSPNLDSLAADAKIRLFKGRFDVAVDPGIQTYAEFENCEPFNLTQCSSTWGVYDLSVPLLLGFNFSERVSVVLSPGVSYAAVAGPGGFGGDTASEVLAGAGVIPGTMARFGVGLDIRVFRRLAIHPEVTFQRSFGDDHLLLWFAGIGFNMGAQPDYSDLAQATSPPAL